MDQIRRIFASLRWTQRTVLLLAAIAAIAAITALSHWSRERDFKPLYTSLSPEDAAAVMAKVRESGTEFRLSEGGTTVLVPSSSVAEVRLQLAGAGIPHSGRIGFELFDKTNFNTSDFAEQVNYHRALEGELERSVMAISEIELARVHLTFPKDSIYLDSKQPAKASVLVKLRPGSKLSPQNVAAISQLTASAVEGLLPEGVSVVDMHGNLLNRPRRTGGATDGEGSDAALEFREKVERDLLVKINATLEPLLGADKFRAAVLADCDLSSGEQSEETFDPAKSVMVTSQKTDDMSGGSQASGVPGAASTLPRPTSRPGSGATSVSRRTESIAYQTSRTVRHMKLPQGNLRKISVSLLIDNAVRWEGSGPKAKKIVEPPSPEKLKHIHDLLVAVIGFSPERGDQLVVDSLPFEATLNAVPPVPESASPAPTHPDPLRDLLKNKTMLIAAGSGAGVILLLLISVIVLLRKRPDGSKIAPGAPQVGAPATPPPADINKQIANQMAEHEALKHQQELEALSALKLKPVSTKKTEVLTKHIIEQSKKDAAGFASVVRSWITDPNKR
jgi:flagellar M-ring protein FliF